MGGGRRKEEEEEGGRKGSEEDHHPDGGIRFQKASVFSQPQLGFCSMGVNNGIITAAERERL